MAFLRDWLRHPQRVWLRRALFQIHLWTGIGVGLYIFAVCVSGSAVVFRGGLTKAFTRGPRTVPVSGQRLSDDELGQIAGRDYPNYTIFKIWPSQQPTDAVEIWLERADGQITREFDPYTGKDLGNRWPFSLKLLTWTINFHDNLGLGRTGLFLNGIGAFFTMAMCLTGMCIWWPGIGNWRHSVMFAWRGDWKRFNWELHSTVGFWMLLVVFMFAITGAYLVFTDSFERAINVVSPLQVYCPDVADDPSVCADLNLQTDPDTGEIVDNPTNGPAPKLSFGDELVRWTSRVHYGRFSGTGIEALWVILGLAPPLLFCTGALMWWNRVLRPSAWRARKKARLAARDRTAEMQEIGPRFGS